MGRTTFVAVLALVLVAIIAGAVIAFVVMGGDGDNGDGDGSATGQPSATASTGTPAAEGTPTSSEPTATRAPAAELRAALEALVQDELGAEYIGSCPTQPGTIVPGICSVQLYLSAELATYLLGPPFSEGVGEAVFLHDQAGWSGALFSYRMGDLTVGGEAIVIGAGDCLNFREEPRVSASVLTCQLDGTRGAVTDGPRQADNVTWWYLQGYGWASAEFLALPVE